MKMLSDEALNLSDNNPVDAHRIQSALDALSSTPIPIPASFNDTLRAQLLTPSKPNHSHRWIARTLAAAAMLTLGIFLGNLFSGGHNNLLQGPVAWADVLQAVNHIDHFHLSAFVHVPANPDTPPLYRLDLYYQQPAQWRGQGLDCVQFTSPTANRIFSIKDKKWISPKESHIQLVPKDIVEGVTNKNLLDLILDKLFDGRPPSGEPVKNDQLATAGIEVFDYAYNPSQMWARIWVVKDSHVPIRMKVFNPDADHFMLLEFDYSDPQPSTFFDSAAFEKSLATISAADSDRIYAIGSAPLSGAKPEHPSQINAAMGGYHAPTIRRVLSNDDGDIALITSNPMNRTPAGRLPVEERYESITDSLGNRYIQVGWSESAPSQDDRRYYFSPVGDYKTSNADRKLTLSYAIDIAENGKWTQDQVLATQTVAVAPPTEKGRPDDWNPTYLRQAKSAALAHYLQSTGTLAQQLAAVETALKQNPDSIDALLWKISLLREHDRESQAWILFEQKLLEPILAHAPEKFDFSSAQALGQYLIYLQSHGRTQEVNNLVDHLQKIRDQGLASSNRNLQNQTKQIFEEKWSLLSQAIHLPEWLSMLDQQKPVVLQTLASKDGFICIQMCVPPQPEIWQGNGGSYSEHFKKDTGWFWDGLPQTGHWLHAAELLDTHTGDFWIVVKPAPDESATHLTIGGKVIVARDNSGPGHPDNDILYPWSVDATLPAPSIDSMPAWWQANTANRNAMQWFAHPYQTWPNPSPAPTLNDVYLLNRDKKYDQAIAIERQLLASHEDLLTRAALVQSLSNADHFTEAQQVFDTLNTANSAPPEMSDALRAAQLAYANALIRHHQLDAAKTLLDQLAKSRPNLADIPDRDTTIDLGHGATTNRNLRGYERDNWREFDTVWWNFHDATSSKN